MEFIPKKPMLEFRENDLEEIRKKYNLDKPGRMKDAVDILQEWVQKQTHFLKKDFSRTYLEITIIMCKGSLERAKTRIDKMCTFRTMLPQFFGDFNAAKDFKQFFYCFAFGILPKKDDNHNTLAIGKILSTKLYPGYIMDLFKVVIIVGEYFKVHDYCDGYIFIIDFGDVEMMDLVKNLDPLQVRNGMAILIEGLGCRVKGIHYIYKSKIIETLLNIVKPVLSAKIADRIFVHNDIEALYEVVPRDHLPSDFGGKEKPLEELHNEWQKLYCSEEHREYMREMNAAGTDESLRQTNIFNEQYMGMPGTFRALSVD